LKSESFVIPDWPGNSNSGAASPEDTANALIEKNEINNAKRILFFMHDNLVD
jgi:hypothetical protein